MSTKYAVTVQYRSQKTIQVTASTPEKAVEIATRRFENSGRELIACKVEASKRST